MSLQSRLPGTIPKLSVVRKAHREAIAAERDLEDQLAAHKDTATEIREALKLAKKKRRAAEDDLSAAEAVEAAEKGERLP